MAVTADARACIVKAWRRGGFLDAVEAGGPQLDRVRTYLRAFADDVAGTCSHPLQRPGYPCFPGLRHLPWHDRNAHPGVAALEAAFPVIRAEYEALDERAYLHYTPPSMTNRWAVYLFHHMGVDLEPFARHAPATAALLRGLPAVCLDYPWGDALLSVHASNSHLAAHCSIDNLRLRCHLGIAVPRGSEMRVGSETRTWREGEALLFEDSFEHEVWNRGTQRRAILIVDFWHPDLTNVEVRALTAAFRKSDVREQFLLERIGMAQGADATLVEFLRRAVRAQDDDARLREYWRA